MLLRVSHALAIVALLTTSAMAQVVRFETSVGSFDMVLNPTNDPRLQAHVDNMLQYVGKSSYRGVWINRAGEDPDGNDFVLQMGGFYSHTKRPPLTIDSTRPVFAYDPVPGEPAVTFSNLSNTIGTVSLALSGSNPDSGSSSFFINVADNVGLDDQFTVFAAISNMTVVNQIMDLVQSDLTDPARNPPFGVGAGNLAFVDVPLQENGQVVLIKRVFVVEDAMTIAMAQAAVESVVAASAASYGDGSNSGSAASSALLSSAAVPEPASGVMLLVGLIAFLGRRHSRPR